ncbi:MULTISPECIES: diguanylate cyclase [Stenotrophomonas]|uniref:diguanylate cyclase domain-containing protein n=1 Tax=Stenotrophomonas TaxID=40323 RepID=UPI0022773DA8|nr:MULTISPECIES: diguanylate cyclase [Stenotrophomonas]
MPPNRRHFEERSAQIIAAGEATGHLVAVLMVDVDDLKKINDSHVMTHRFLLRSCG